MAVSYIIKCLLCLELGKEKMKKKRKLSNAKYFLYVIWLFALVFVVMDIVKGPREVGDDVKYDSELIEQFEQFPFDRWVHVMVDVKDFSNITIDNKDSIEVQTIKDNLRWSIYKNTSEAVLSTLSENEFRLKSKSEWGTFFSGNITKEGFRKLLKDERVRKIYAKKKVKLA